MNRHCVAVLLQHLECELCIEAMQFFQSGGVCPVAYCYDGFMIPKPNNMSIVQTLLKKINTLHPRIEFIVKPFGTALDMSDVGPRGITFAAQELNSYYFNAKT